MDAEAAYEIVGYAIPGTPTASDEITQKFDAVAAVQRGHRRAILALAEEIERSTGD